MPLWKNQDAASNAPVYMVDSGHGVSANGYQLYGNTQVGAFEAGVAVGVFGVDATEAGITSGEGKRVQHAGWNLRRAGTGPVSGITLTGGNVDYQTGGYITFSGGGGTGANASYTVNTTTNTIVTVTLVSGGSGYTSAPTATAANATAVNSATFTVTTGGRAGRVEYETLVAMGSMTGDGSDDTLFPDS